MRRLLAVVLVVLVATLALPPLYFLVAPAPLPQMPPPGVHVAVGNGVGVNALVKGDGPPIVLVHGLPGSAYDWTRLQDALAERGFRVIAYDRVGYGRSDARPDDDFSIAANARDLLGLLKSEELQDATLVGWSYGGPVVLEATGRDASRIARLVLIGSAGPPEATPPPPAFFEALVSKPVLTWLRAVPPAGRAVQAAISRDAFSGQPQPSWWLPLVAANFASPHTTDTYYGEVSRFSAGDMAIDPVAVAKPMLLIHGDDDRLAPASIAEWIESHARDAELVVIEKGSHMLPVTHAEQLADRIAAFVRAGQSAEPEEG